MEDPVFLSRRRVFFLIGQRSDRDADGLRSGYSGDTEAPTGGKVLPTACTFVLGTLRLRLDAC